MANKSVDDMLDTLRNPRWAVSGNITDMSPVALECVQNGLPGVFVASPLDPEEWGRQVHIDCIAGKYGDIGPYQPPVVTVEMEMSRQTHDCQDYMQAAMAPREPGPDRQVIYTEMQAALTTQGYHMSQVPLPWDRPLEPSDQAYFDAGIQAFKDTIDYLNGQVKGAKLPSFKRKGK